MCPRPIKIGINASMLDDQPSGIGIYTANLINTLFQRFKTDVRYEMTVYSPTLKYLNSDIKIIKLHSLLQSSRYGRIAAGARFLFNLFLFPFFSGRYDLVLCPTSHGSFLISNQIFTIHDLLSLRYNNINAHQRFYFKTILPLIVKRSVLIIAISESTKRDIIRYLKCAPEKIRVIYNGFNKQVFNNQENTLKPINAVYGVADYFLVVGPTYSHKNITRLIEAFALLPSDFRHLHPLVIAGGRPEYLQLLKSQSSTLKLDSYVHFIGHVPDQYMPDLYREAFSLVFPSLHEGFGFPLLEAMACGCPVITSSTASMPEVCGDAAHYIQPLSTISIKNALLKIILDPGFRKQLILKGLERVNHFSWESTAAQIESSIDQYFNHPTISVYAGH